MSSSEPLDPGVRDIFDHPFVPRKLSTARAISGPARVWIRREWIVVAVAQQMIPENVRGGSSEANKQDDNAKIIDF